MFLPIVAALAAAGLFTVYKVTRSPGEKANKGDLVRAPVKAIAIALPGQPIRNVAIPGLQGDEVASIKVTSADQDNLYGTLNAVASSRGSVVIPPGLGGDPGSIVVSRTAVLG